MTLAIRELPTSRQLKVSLTDPEAHFEYIVFQTTSENAARALVEAQIGPFYISGDGGVLPYQSYDLTPLGNGIWHVVAHYGLKQQRGAGAHPNLSGTDTGTPPGGGSPLQNPAGTSGGRDASFNFEIGTQTFKTVTAITTVAGYAPVGMTAPDNNGAIGVNGDQLEGCDVDKPTLTFSETHYFPAAYIDQNYVVRLRDLMDKPVNAAAFRGFEPGEVRFVGATGALKDESSWEITFKFAVSPNKTNLSIGQYFTGAPIITGIIKKGWEYLDVMYEQKLSQNVLMPQPRAVYIHQVYESSSFDVLGIGA